MRCCSPKEGLTSPSSHRTTDFQQQKGGALVETPTLSPSPFLPHNLGVFVFIINDLRLLTARLAIPISRDAQGQMACASLPGSITSGLPNHIASSGGCDMRQFDLTPLYRSTIGFDRLGSLLDTLGSFEGEAPSYPPYNIERVGENDYRISMAVAGFGDSDLNIEVKENTLTVKGERLTEKEDTTFLHRGIASRSFERRFQLADHVVVKGASLENGLLHIDLARELPEAKKPRTVPITTARAEKPKVIDSRAA